MTDDLVPLSALQHLLFCERQCALIHVERAWAENRWTAEGNVLHRRAHEAPAETRGGVRIARGLPLVSHALGLVGQADVVEFEPPADATPGSGTLVERLNAAEPDERRRWRVTPVEYKRGKPKANDCDRVQLCAQALCLEEMLGVTIASGQLFYGERRRRTDVDFDEPLRATTRAAARRVHELITTGTTPPAVREKKCDTCSLIDLCLPDLASGTKSARRFLARELQFIESDQD
jgi:CRISPR-associated exonuclease Cas4